MKLRRTTIISAVLITFLLGVVFARTKLQLHLLVCLVPLVCAVAVWRKARRLATGLIILCAFSIGWWRGGVYMQSIARYEALYKKPVTIIATANEDAVYSEKRQLAFSVSNIKVIQPKPQHLVGSVNIEGFGVPMVYKGDRLRLQGKLYPTRGSRIASMKFAKAELVTHHTSVVETVRHRFQAAIYSALPEPQASFALGLLLGQRSSLPKEITNMLSVVGLTHIIAVSGYNLTILIEAAKSTRAKKSRYQAVLISVMLMVGFILCTGFSASILRASLVSTLSLLAWYYGRSFRPVLLIALAAVITVAYYPPYIWSDIGWYLSFLAFFGILVLAPLLTRRVYRGKEPKIVAVVFIETLCAQLLTLPLILFIFGRVSPFSLLANMLVVPFVPLAMFGALVAGVSGMAWPAIGALVAWPTTMLLRYMLDMAKFFANLPYAAFEYKISGWFMVALYAAIVVVCVLLQMKTRVRRAIMEPIIDD